MSKAKEKIEILKTTTNDDLYKKTLIEILESILEESEEEIGSVKKELDKRAKETKELDGKIEKELSKKGVEKKIGKIHSKPEVPSS